MERNDNHSGNNRGSRRGRRRSRGGGGNQGNRSGNRASAQEILDVADELSEEELLDDGDDSGERIDVSELKGTAMEALVELGKSTSKRKTYRRPEAKPFTGMFEQFGSVGCDKQTEAAK